MKHKWKNEFDKLIGSLRDDQEVGSLFRELLTPHEYEALILRWQIVELLIEGVPQRIICDELKVSIATVTRGSRELKYGKGALHKFYSRLNKS